MTRTPGCNEDLAPTATSSGSTRVGRALAGALIGLCVVGLSAGSALASRPVAIRVASDNVVPACVTPERLTAFLRSRNPNLAPQFAGIAELYRRHGEIYRVRWDYAFYQMVLETNYLMFKRGDGKSGDVRMAQNNFAGLGATGGGVPGDRYPDVSTGVLAQIQHLVVYSGERVSEPIGPRTRLAQDAILSGSLRLRRAVTFADLTNRWAADRNYWRSIDTIAERFRADHCTGREPVVAAAAPNFPPVVHPRPVPAVRPTASPPAATAASTQGALQRTALAGMTAPAVSPTPSPSPSTTAPTDTAQRACRISAASFGGTRTVLLRQESPREVHLTAVSVTTGFEQMLTDRYIAQSAQGARQLGTYPTKDDALLAARALCATGR